MNRKFLLLILIIFILNFSLSKLYASCLPYPTVESGKVLKDCNHYKAIGVNYVDAFYRTLKNPEDKSYIQGFEKLSKHGIPFVRMMAGGFWPKDWELYFKDKEKYFTLLDNVVKTAEKYNIGIIMSLFWYVSTIPDLMGEPISAWGEPESKTVKFMKTYTKEVVSRYKDSKAIWGWEFGEGYNLIIDLPKGYKKVAPQYGTPRYRTAHDKLSWKDLVIALEIFADTVKKIDRNRIISTGNSIPRPFAYNLAFFGKWRQDTLNQFLDIFNLIEPKSYNVVSIHLYPPRKGQYFADVTADSFDELLKYTMLGAKRFNRILFIPEFGVCKMANKNLQEEKNLFNELVAAIYNSDVSLSALWVYDFKKQEGSCNVTFENERNYQLETIMNYNKKMIFKNN